eukprot:Gregarina_sp_Poly_1__4702@NODE_2510_length_2045_cov_71_877149_g1595_i0_p1_GENE_NODE_2510_length_2045_cov_71_877149_g1595_i0NODE_2510_length_2045_cov_71_877149_g1595_i0_p1_ORF_typecomplete_len257_score29_67_NODE_2510_length_2045_cov_71_877149_g1595_i046816
MRAVWADNRLNQPPNLGCTLVCMAAAVLTTEIDSTSPDTEAQTIEESEAELTDEERAAIPDNEIVHNVKLNKLQYRRDLDIMRKPIKDLTSEELERRLTLATADQSVKEAEWNTKFIKGNYRSRLLDIAPSLEHDEKERALELALNFIRSVRVVVPLFLAREQHVLAKAIALDRRRIAMKSFSQADIDAYRRARTHIVTMHSQDHAALNERVVNRATAHYRSLSPFGKFWYNVGMIIRMIAQRRAAPKANEYETDD